MQLVRKIRLNISKLKKVSKQEWLTFHPITARLTAELTCDWLKQEKCLAIQFFFLDLDLNYALYGLIIHMMFSE